MKLTRLLCCATRFFAVGVSLASLAGLASAQTATSGTIEGRVLNVTNGNYLNNARITVEGGNAETFSDRTGQYRLSNVPAGDAKIKVFYTGLTERELTVTVPSGATVTQDISLSAGTTAEGEVLKLDQFVVDSRKDTDQKSIAINEQRFAANMKSVV
jgi:iron complex outermembrane receptor protein